MLNNTSWLIIILITLILIYYLYNQDNKISSNQKVKKIHKTPKRIYISPQSTINNKSIEKMTNKLIKRLDTPKTNFTIKLYYADWCPHCVEFKPIWNKLKINYKNKINFIDVNCTDNQPNLPFISGYPTIALFKLDKHIENYENDRTYESFKQYLDKLNL